jgi:hypothetical protein
MKKSIILIVLFAVCFTATDVFGQKDRKAKKARKGDAQTEQSTTGKKPDGSKETSTTGKTPATAAVKTEATNQSREVKPIEVVNIDELIQAATPVITPQANGQVNWSEQFIEATGSAVIDYDRFPNQAQARAMATRGAIVVAQRNLLEIIQGVNVVSETTVKDMMIQSDYIYTRVDGVVKGAQQFGEAIEKDGMIEVKMRIPMYETNGLAPAVYDGIAQLPGMGNRALVQTDIEVGEEGLPSGLVFNFNGKTYDPSMFPMVVDKDGKLLLDMTKFYDPKEGKFPKILSGTKDIFKEIKFKEGTQIIDVIESFDGKIVVDPESVKKVNWEKIQKGVATATKVFKFILTVI